MQMKYGETKGSALCFRKFLKELLDVQNKP